MSLAGVSQHYYREAHGSPNLALLIIPHVSHIVHVWHVRHASILEGANMEPNKQQALEQLPQ